MTAKKTTTVVSTAASKCPKSKSAPKSSPKRNKLMLAQRLIMMPKDTNGMGNIFGGVLLSLMDLAGSDVAKRACKNNYTHRMVTRFMDKVEFKQPVHVNDVVSCYGSITKIGNTSVSVHVEVEADRAGAVIPVTSCDMVFVAVDEKGEPTSVIPGGRDCATGKAKGKTSALRKSPSKRKQRTLAQRLIMMPKDTNGMGSIFGGVLLSLMDLAGSDVAKRACKNNYTHRMVTRFMDKVEFKQPVHVNDVVSCYGSVLKIGNTSVTVQIEVEVDRGGTIIPVTSCDMVFVALDEDGKPTSVNPAGRPCATGKAKGKTRTKAAS